MVGLLISQKTQSNRAWSFGVGLRHNCSLFVMKNRIEQKYKQKDFAITHQKWQQQKTPTTITCQSDFVNTFSHAGAPHSCPTCKTKGCCCPAVCKLGDACFSTRHPVPSKHSCCFDFPTAAALAAPHKQV